MCKITLADGTVIGSLVMNGNNFISDNTSLRIGDFEGKLDTVTIQYEGDDGQMVTEVMNDAVISLFEISATKVTFVLNEKTKVQKAAEQLEKTMKTDYESIVDLQLAVTELYEMIIEL